MCRTVLGFIASALTATFAFGFGMPAPSAFTSEAADEPVDTRIYIVSNYRKTIALTGWTVGQPVKVMDAPMRVSATITPAKIVYSNPQSGEALGVSTFIGMTLFGTVHCRQYQTDNGYIDLIDEFAVIKRVKALQTGPNFGSIGAYYECQDIVEEDTTPGVGLQMGKRKRKLWEDANPASLFPANKGVSSSTPQPAMPRQTQGISSQQQKQLVLSDIEMQISQQENMLQRLRLDLIDAESNLQSAIATDSGWVMANSRVIQIKGEISRAEMQLNFLRQQRMRLMSQP